MAGVPSSLLNTLSASHPVTKTPAQQHPMTSITGFAPDGTRSMRRRVAAAVMAKPGAVLTGSLGYADEYLDDCADPGGGGDARGGRGSDGGFSWHRRII